MVVSIQLIQTIAQYSRWFFIVLILCSCQSTNENLPLICNSCTPNENWTNRNSVFKNGVSDLFASRNYRYSSSCSCRIEAGSAKRHACGNHWNDPGAHSDIFSILFQAQPQQCVSSHLCTDCYYCHPNPWFLSWWLESLDKGTRLSQTGHTEHWNTIAFPEKQPGPLVLRNYRNIGICICDCLFISDFTTFPSQVNASYPLTLTTTVVSQCHSRAVWSRPTWDSKQFPS